MPCGSTKSGPSCTCTERSRRGQAATIATSISTEQISVQASAPSCSESSAVIKADPAKPPMLNSAWKPDISGRPRVALHLDRMDVHGDVDGAERGAESEQGQRQRCRRARDRQQGQAPAPDRARPQ